MGLVQCLGTSLIFYHYLVNLCSPATNHLIQSQGQVLELYPMDSMDFPMITPGAKSSNRRQGATSRIRAAPRQVHGGTQGRARRDVVATDHDPW